MTLLPHKKQKRLAITASLFITKLNKYFMISIVMAEVIYFLGAKLRHFHQPRNT